jgi:HKD family nuclease
MEIISNPKALTAKFKKLLQTCTSVSGSVAWASAANPIFDLLKTHEIKIKEFVVGLHFYQTDPHFIKAFLRRRKVRYMMKETQGIFHPKMYLFENESKWTIVIGSANFTKAAFTINDEIVVIFSGTNFEDTAYCEAKKIINGYWQKAELFSLIDLKNYTKMANIQKSKINNLSGKYDFENIKTEKPTFKIEMMTMEWDAFFDKVVNSEDEDTIQHRIDLLDTAKLAFNTKKQLLNMSENERKEIGGLGSNRGLAFGCFGTMESRGYFKNRININEINLSLALDEIPIEGKITKEHYDNFIEIFKLSLPKNIEIAGASRLLTLKRPDYFVNFNGKNKAKLCEEFDIQKSKFGYDDYWNLVIARITDSVWWKSASEPEDDFEKKIFEYRSAFLDSICYEWN